MRRVFAEDGGKVAARILESWILFRVERSSRADHADVTDGHVLLVHRRKKSLIVQLFVHALTHARIRAISADENVAMVVGIVGATDHDALVVLQDGQDLLAHENL